MSYRIIALSVLLASLAVPRLEATLLRPITFTALVAKAQAIAYGRVVDLRARYSDDRTKIETVVTLEVATYLKGDFGEQLTFTVPGGTLGRYRAMVVGAPQFSEGEEVVLFLTAQAPAIPKVVGLNQGVFRVSVDVRTGERTIGRVPILDAGAKVQPFLRGSPANRPMSLGAFNSLVRGLMESGR